MTLLLLYIIVLAAGWYGLPPLIHGGRVKWVGLPRGWVFRGDGYE